MPRRSGITRKLLDEILDKPWYKDRPEIKTRVEADLARSAKPLKKRDESVTLDRKEEGPAGMVHIDSTLLVRLIRIVGKGSRVYDDDNYSGGLKECRDAVASALGLTGDSKEDGITFKYIQEVDRAQQTHIEIEIYEVK